MLRGGDYSTTHLATPYMDVQAKELDFKIKQNIYPGSSWALSLVLARWPYNQILQSRFVFT